MMDWCSNLENKVGSQIHRCLQGFFIVRYLVFCDEYKKICRHFDTLQPTMTWKNQINVIRAHHLTQIGKCLSHKLNNPSIFGISDIWFTFTIKISWYVITSQALWRHIMHRFYRACTLDVLSDFLSSLYHLTFFVLRTCFFYISVLC